MTVRNRGRGEHRRWYYDFNIRGTRYRASIPEARTKADAVEAENAERRQVFEGTYGSPKLGARLFSEFVDTVYLPWAETNKRSWQDDVWVATVLKDTFRGKKLCEVSPLIIEKLKRDLKEQKTKRDRPRSAASVNLMLSIGSSIFTLAVDTDQAARNPFRKVKKLPVDNQQFRYLDWEEEARLFEVLVNPPVKVGGTHEARAFGNSLLAVVCVSRGVRKCNVPQGAIRRSQPVPGAGGGRCSRNAGALGAELKAAQRAHLRAAIPIALGTGLRLREQTRLQVKHCDFARNLIVVEHTNINPTKTNRLRTVPMNDDVRAIMRRLCQGKRPDDYLLVNQTTKKPYLDFKKGFASSCAEAGITGLTWKALRHTFGTRLGEAGHSAYDIADLMGHSDVRTSMRYVHATDRRKHEAVQSTMLSRRATA
jgi:hypothetical protein